MPSIFSMFEGGSMLTIHNIRLGHANNSSSSHSIVILPTYLAQTKEVPSGDGEKQYGWDNFVLVTPVEKMNYFKLLVRGALRSSFGHETVEYIVQNLSKKEEEEEKEGYSYIDHQSEFTFPIRAGSWGRELDIQFIREFEAFLCRADVAILGGNDNEEKHPLTDATVRMPFMSLLQTDSGISIEKNALMSRKDPSGFWVIFNQKTGAKIRFSFETSNGAPIEKALPKALPAESEADLWNSYDEEKIAEKSHLPELVDVKITDFCPFGCSYCYMDSTKKGQHGDYNALSTILCNLASIGVFEVALGGGEPTYHPEFREIVRDIRDFGMVPNFTTKNPFWLNDPQICHAVEAYCGSFAFSITSEKDAIQILKKLEIFEKTYNIGFDRMSFQVVLGTLSDTDLKYILKLACDHYIKTTMLGYKLTGRGKNFNPLPKNNLYKIFCELSTEEKLGGIGIDTIVAKEYEDELQLLGISDKLYSTEEGKHSMYIDGVLGRMGPSSYCEDEEMVEVKEKDWIGKIKEYFPKW